jgi:hypothetical protein
MPDEVVNEVAWVGMALAVPGEVAAEGEINRAMGHGQNERGDAFRRFVEEYVARSIRSREVGRAAPDVHRGGRRARPPVWASR